ncbi:MAG TPA: polysaccharide deacetylase family protein [Thermodesulfobacteriota bacterium]|nr:polysaccharide deacetylase family protein [Thermodesulfobacteriota bacterium]
MRNNRRGSRLRSETSFGVQARTRPRSLITNAMTIDVEDWYHPELVRDHLGSGVPEERLSEVIPSILDLLNRYHVKATFFVLGEVASRFPALIRQIEQEGHEIGCHGMSHRMLGDLGEEGFKKEMEDFRNLTKEILGNVNIRGFRAPTFSLNPDTKWALPILRDFGYRYDSSIFPEKLFWNPLYGIDNAPRYPYRISFEDLCKEDPKSPLWEFPAAIARVGRIDLPVSGGFYLRTIPAFIFRWALDRMNRTGPFYIYLHPWECDENTPRIPLPFLSRGVTYYGIRKVLSHLEGLLKTFSFSRMDDVLDRMGAFE